MTRTRIPLRWPIIGLVAAFFAYASARDAAVFAFGVRAPEFARRLSPYDATAVASGYNKILLGPEPYSKPQEPWRSAASNALRQNPLSAGALRVQALSTAAGAANEKRVRALMHLSEQVSRRDLVTQMWLIEDSVAQGDVQGALAHYDRALSVTPAASQQLFPILTNAIDAPEIRAALASYASADRMWARGFLEHAITNSADPTNVVDLFRRYGGSAKVPEHRYLETMLLGRLVANGNVAVARDYALRMSPRNRNAVDIFAFSAATLDAELRPLTWEIGADTRVDANYDPADGLDVVVGPGTRAVAASRVMILRPGKWVLTQTVNLPALGPMANSSWAAYCLNEKGAVRFWLQDIPRQSGTQTYQSTVNVPNGCGGTRFDLTVRGSDSQEDARIRILKAHLSS